MSSAVAEVSEAQLVSFLSCPLCDKLFEEATTINECLHTFCRQCIYTKISEENLEHCPKCNINLGPNALQKLRPDKYWQDIRAKVFPIGKESSLPPSLETQSAIDSIQVVEAEANTEGHPPESKDIVPVPVNSNEGTVLKGNTSKSKKSRRKAKTDDGEKKKKAPPAKNSNAAETKKPAGNSRKKKGPAKEASDLRADCESKGVWISLFASEEQEGRATLPQIPSRYLRIMDGNATVSHIQKYVIKKLELSSEAEIEIQCMGVPVDPNLEVRNLSKLWMQSAPPSQRFAVTPGSSGEQFVVTLGYIRKLNNVHPSLACLQDYADSDD